MTNLPFLEILFIVAVGAAGIFMQVLNNYTKLESFAKAIVICAFDHAFIIFVFACAVTFHDSPKITALFSVVIGILWYLLRRATMGDKKYLAVGSVLITITFYTVVLFTLADRILMNK